MFEIYQENKTIGLRKIKFVADYFITQPVFESDKIVQISRVCL